MMVLALCILLLPLVAVRCQWFYDARYCCNKLNKLEQRLQSLEAFVREYQAIRKHAATDLKRDVQDDEAPAPQIGFLARYDAELIDTGEDALVMPYTHVIWNEGGAYSNVTHTFKAPLAGLYAFHVNAMSGTNHGCVSLFRNDNKITSGWAPEMYGTMHISVGLMLEKGDRVQVRVCPYATIDNDTGNSFSGYLVRAKVKNRHDINAG